jgi:hypothetical protein
MHYFGDYRWSQLVTEKSIRTLNWSQTLVKHLIVTKYPLIYH